MEIYLNIGQVDILAIVRMVKFGSELRYGIRSPNVRTPVDIPTPNTPRNESGLIQLIMMDKSICQLWVKQVAVNNYINLGIYHSYYVDARLIWIFACQKALLCHTASQFSPIFQ